MLHQDLQTYFTSIKAARAHICRQGCESCAWLASLAFHVLVFPHQFCIHTTFALLAHSLHGCTLSSLNTAQAVDSRCTCHMTMSCKASLHVKSFVSPGPAAGLLDAVYADQNYITLQEMQGSMGLRIVDQAAATAGEAQVSAKVVHYHGTTAKFLRSGMSWSFLCNEACAFKLHLA